MSNATDRHGPRAKSWMSKDTGADTKARDNPSNR